MNSRVATNSLDNPYWKTAFAAYLLAGLRTAKSLRAAVSAYSDKLDSTFTAILAIVMASADG